MTVAGIALIAVGLAILVGGRRLLWGSAGGRRRGRAGRELRAIAAAAAGGSARTSRDRMSLRRGRTVPIAPVEEPGDADAETEVVPRPRVRRSRRRISAATAAPGRAGDEPQPSGLASIGLADDDDGADGDGIDGEVEGLERTVVSAGHVAEHEADDPADEPTGGSPADDATGSGVTGERTGLFAADDPAVGEDGADHDHSDGDRSDDPADHAAVRNAAGQGPVNDDVVRPAADNRAAPDADGEPEVGPSPAGPLMAASQPDRQVSHPYDDRVHHADRVDGWVRPDYRQYSVDLPVGGEYWTPVDGDPYGDRSTGGYGRPSGERAARSPYEPAWPYRPTFDPDAYSADRSSVSQWPPAHRDDRYDTVSMVSPSAYPMDGPIWARPSDPDPSVPALAWAGPFDANATGTGPGLGHPAGDHPDDAPDGMGEAAAATPDDPDRDGRHLPRRSRSAVRRNGTRAEPAPEPAYRGRGTHPRLEARRRLTPADLGSGASDPTEMLPPVPVIEGYGPDGARDGQDVRARDAEPPRPRPRPRPRSGNQPSDDRQPNRSTVYVSRHAAEPN